jgi:hypothetical protein
MSGIVLVSSPYVLAEYRRLEDRRKAAVLAAEKALAAGDLQAAAAARLEWDTAFEAALALMPQLAPRDV